MKTKTPEIRARELFTLVYKDHPHASFIMLTPAGQAGWIRLGKFVLSLERKWSKAKLRPTP